MSPNFADLLLLVDSRLPAGGHAHSGGIAPAIEAGLIKDINQLEAALRTRLKHQGPMQSAAVKLAAKGILPTDAKPAAVAIISCSAIPQLKKRSGNSFAKIWV